MLCICCLALYLYAPWSITIITVRTIKYNFGRLKPIAPHPCSSVPLHVNSMVGVYWCNLNSCMNDRNWVLRTAWINTTNDAAYITERWDNIPVNLLGVARVDSLTVLITNRSSERCSQLWSTSSWNYYMPDISWRFNYHCSIKYQKHVYHNK